MFSNDDAGYGRKPMLDARNGVALLLCLLAVGGLGCVGRLAESAIPAKEREVAFTTLTWGSSSQGLQCRLRPAKRLWRAAETPTFRIDLRNRSERVFALACEPLRPDRISIDGQWRRWPDSGPEGTKMLPFGSGAELVDMVLSLPRETIRLLAKGRHVIRIAFLFEGIEIVSNSVEIEIVA
jgi:hypothetical protein